MSLISLKRWLLFYDYIHLLYRFSDIVPYFTIHHGRFSFLLFPFYFLLLTIVL